MPAARKERGGHPTPRHTIERGRCILQFAPRLRTLHLTESQHRVPEWEFPPSVLAVTHRSEVQRAATQTLFASVKTTSEQITPQPDAALAAAVKTRIVVAGIRSCARETSHQPIVSRSERA